MKNFRKAFSTRSIPNLLAIAAVAVAGLMSAAPRAVHAGAMSDYTENKLIDFTLRAQALGITGATAAAGTGPTSTCLALFTATPSDTGGGTEVSGGSYARVCITSSLANWAGTQGAGTTTASTGTSGTTSNNSTVTYPAPTANWGTIVATGLYDASSGGNLLFWGPLASSKVVNSGDAAPSFAPGAVTIQFDN